MLQLSGLTLRPGQPEQALTALAERALGVPVRELTILRASIDARHKSDVRLTYTVACTAADGARAMANCPHAAVYAPAEYRPPRTGKTFPMRPVVVGAGPAGLFCALLLARAGARPILLERGKPVEQRVLDVEAHRAGGPLLPESNLQFGEGGAGTFSDGKLSTGVNDPRMAYILRQFVSFGAPAEILYQALPHVGTDRLRQVVTGIRRELLALGVEVRFQTRMTGLACSGGRVAGVRVTGPSGEETIRAEQVCLAIGHSARDTVQALYDQGVPMEAKRFAVGVRIEHLQRDISLAQYGAAAELLPPATYKLSCHLPDGRSAYSFCVCPGGTVMAAASEPQTVVTNGMSEYARDRDNINGALLVGVGPEDYPGGGPLAGIAFQRQLEHAAFLAGGGAGLAPAQQVGDFLSGRKSVGFGRVTPSYRPGVVPADLHDCLPEDVSRTIGQALPLLGRRLRGYDDPQAVLTAVESRSSSPVRILRGADLQSSVAGLYPCGEGAGYAGGIMSAAADGIRCAERMLGEDIL